MGVTAARRTDNQLELLHRRGARTIHGPMLTTRPFGPDDELAAAIDALVARPPQIVVLSTGVALLGLLEAAEALGTVGPLREALSGAALVARGSKAAEAAAAEGWDVAWQAPDASSAEVVEHLGHVGVQGQRVGILLDGHESPVLVQQTAALGAGVVSVPVYRWELPDPDGPAGRLITVVAERALDAVTFTSSAGVANFVATAHDVGRFEEVRTALGGPVLGVSIGPVCTAAIIDAGFAPPVEPAAARLDAMVDALGDHATERRRIVEAGHVDLLLDATHPVIGGMVVEMGPRERGVLDVLAHRPGAVVSKVTLCRQVWGRSTGLHAVEVTVGRLRDRLASACGRLLWIDTVPRRGYRLVGAGQEGAAQRSATTATWAG